MLVLVFAALYAACAALVLTVWLQDRRRDAARGGRRPVPDPRTTLEFVFRTQA